MHNRSPFQMSPVFDSNLMRPAPRSASAILSADNRSSRHALIAAQRITTLQKAQKVYSICSFYDSMQLMAFLFLLNRYVFFIFYAPFGVSVFCVLNFLYVLIYKTAASNIDRMSASGCAQTNPVSPKTTFKMNRAGMKIIPCLLKLITSEAVAAPIACKALVRTQNTPNMKLVVILCLSLISSSCTASVWHRLLFYQSLSIRAYYYFFILTISPRKRILILFHIFFRPPAAKS